MAGEGSKKKTNRKRKEKKTTEKQNVALATFAVRYADGAAGPPIPRP